MHFIFDISPPISESLAVWPGDTPLRREILLDMNRGDAITLSTLHATAHLGMPMARTTTVAVRKVSTPGRSPTTWGPVR